MLIVVLPESPCPLWLSHSANKSALTSKRTEPDEDFATDALAARVHK